MKKSHTFYTTIDVEEKHPDLHKLLCIPFYVDSVEVEITYNYIEAERGTRFDPYEPAQVEVESARVIKAWVQSGDSVDFSEVIGNKLDNILDEEELELKCFEDAEKWFVEGVTNETYT